MYKDIINIQMNEILKWKKEIYIKQTKTDIHHSKKFNEVKTNIA